MAKSINPDWLLLPDLPFRDIMLNIGLESLESLHRCRQVCSTWNDNIMANIWGNPGIKQIIATRMRNVWDPETEKLPSHEMISHAKWLGTLFIIE